MSDFRNNSRLFPHSSRTNRELESARRAQSILEQMQRELRNPTTATNRNIRDQSRRLADAVRSAGGRVPVASQLLDLASTAGRLAEGFRKSMLNQTLEALGTPGHLIQSWLRGREGALSLRPLRETVDQAMRILGQFGQGIDGEGDDGRPMSPEEAGGRRTFTRRPLRQIPIPGVTPGAPSNPYAPMTPAGPAPNSSPSPAGSGSGNRLPPVPPPPDPNSPHRNVRILPDGRLEIRGPGYHRILAADDPVITGQMMRVASSNVYAIGFEFNFDEPLRSKLIIRYKQNDRRGSGRNVGGPTYEYFDVHPDWFQDLVDTGSKGSWVWDHLRIRGTVAGHQYAYNLTRIAQGYLPRRAMVLAGIQRLVRRSRSFVQGGRTQTITSPLPDRVLGQYSPPRGSAANVGNRDRAVDRGMPNRGAPARGLFR